jgi:hypothetical protein
LQKNPGQTSRKQAIIVTLWHITRRPIGLLVTIYRIISDSAFIQKIKEEFVFGNFRARIQEGNGIYNIK